MELSCGGILQYQDKILIVRNTGSKFWNLPKGVMQGDEKPIYTAIRQIKEQTNIDVSGIINALDFGQHQYLSNKNLHLFLFRLSKQPTDIKCMSVFKTKGGVQLPQISQFKWCTLSEAKDLFSDNINKVIYSIFCKLDLFNTFFPKYTYDTNSQHKYNN